MGRGFTAQDAIIGNNTVVIISHGMWQRRFGAARDVIGRRLLIEGMPYSIVGVMPPTFNFPNKQTEYWQPYAFEMRNVGLLWAVGGKEYIARLAPRASDRARTRAGRARGARRWTRSAHAPTRDREHSARPVRSGARRRGWRMS